VPRSVVQRATAEVRAPWLDLYYPAGHIPPQETHQDAITDGFFATFDGPARGIRCAAAIANGAKVLGLDVRAGLHTGECEVMGAKLGGIAVHIGARVAPVR